jgi:hypothetical protein
MFAWTGIWTLDSDTGSRIGKISLSLSFVLLGSSICFITLCLIDKLLIIKCKITISSLLIQQMAARAAKFMKLGCHHIIRGRRIFSFKSILVLESEWYYCLPPCMESKRFEIWFLIQVKIFILKYLWYNFYI